MPHPKFLFAAAVAVLAASPLAARPMTAADMHSMHRLGAPEVSPDGRTAAFTLSTTDWDKNKRVNTLYTLDLARAGATPQPVAGAEKGHDAVFGPDGPRGFLMPVGDGEEIAFSPDGRTVYFALREAGRIEPLSTNLDIFAAPSDGSAPPVNLTAANHGTDNLPAVSPDGRTLAYFAMARAGYEADRQVLMLRDLASGSVRALTQNWDRSVGSIAWALDGRSLVVTAEDTLEQPVFRVDARTGAVTRLTGGGHFDNVHPLPGGGAIVTMNSIIAPDDLYRIDAGGRVSRLTDVNRELLAQLDPVTFSKFSFTGANNDRVWGWELKPAGAAAKLPVLLLVHGGPQGTFSNSWSYRWNPRVFASPGYGVVAIDFHGSEGYGQAFTDAIHQNWGGWPLQDLQLGLAYATAHDPQLDGRKACAAGGSYGGYMMNWVEGQGPHPVKGIVQHDRRFAARGMADQTEELWFDEWEHGGHPYYEAP